MSRTQRARGVDGATDAVATGQPLLGDTMGPSSPGAINIAGGSGPDEEGPKRVLAVMNPAENAAHKFCNNVVTTSRYSLFPFSLDFILYKNLYEQFRKAANFYFLGVTIAQVIPGLSPTGRWTTLVPLVLVLLVTFVKDSWEDWNRRRADRYVNNLITHVFRDGTFVAIPWSQVVVGDVCCIRKNESFPADLLLLWSSVGEGHCYIETASLDGETNLKMRKSPAAIFAWMKKRAAAPANGTHEFNSVPSPALFAASIVCEMPNNRLYHFDGYLERNEGGKPQPRVPLVSDNILLRGSELRNTSHALGVVVFSGVDSKLMRNSMVKSGKWSRLDGVTNRQIFLIFLLQIFLSIVCAVGYRAANASDESDDAWYLGLDDNAAKSAALAWITFMILFNSLIPISLYVMLELVKLVQAFFINSDVLMYSAETNTPAVVRTSKLNEELGQVEYIFSDKTGTLTCNKMQFRNFSCVLAEAGGKCSMVSYGEQPGSMGGMQSSSSFSAGGVSSATYSPSLVRAQPTKDGFAFVDSRINGGAWRGQKNKEEIRFLMQFMAVCHTVIPEADGGGRGLIYQSSSPDETCLVKAALSLGMELRNRTEKAVVIAEEGVEKTWEILNVIEFSSARKRMSVICRDPLGRLMLLCKGADSVVMQRLRRDKATEHLLDETQAALGLFAGDGLRTLVFAKVDLTEDTYKRWKRKFDAASTAIHDRLEKVEAAAEDIEKDMDLVGTTAIEDKLQDNVAATIRVLSAAGTKLWVLTGDKQETALNIGYACALLNAKMGLFTFDDCTPDTLRHALEKYVLDVEAASVESGQEIALVIQGHMLEHALPSKDDAFANEYEADLFVSLATRCKAVICCRVSPIQKAQVVQAVKERVTGVTLAIGDGANDVSMIQTAHVGIGISGLEGLQAARASDYSISEFQFLARLLLVHGHYSYRRVSRLIIFAFYKNMSLYMTQFWYALFNMFTGQSLYDAWALAMYNLAFTSFPIMALAVFDRDVKPGRLTFVDQFPELYQEGVRNKLFNTVEFWKYTVTALVHSLLCFFFPLVCARQLSEPGTGRDYNMAGQAVIGYTCVLFVVTAKCGLETNTWTAINALVVFGSLYVWYLFLFIYCSAFYFFPTIDDFSAWYGVDTPALGSAAYWLIVIVVSVAALIRDFLYKYYRRNYNPTLFHVVQTTELLYGSNDRGRLGDDPAAAGREPTNFTRAVVRKAAPWLFPKHEVKAFKPTLSEGMGRHRFSKQTSLAEPTEGVEMVEMTVIVPPSRGLTGGAVGSAEGGGSSEGILRRPDLASGADASPGRRRQRITDIIEDDL